MKGPVPHLRSAAASRRGPLHDRNEDAWCIHGAGGSIGSPSLFGGLFDVCDGVTTAGGGELAAQLTCERLGQFAEEAGTDGRKVQVSELMQLVNEIDWELRGAGRGAACTLSLLWLDEFRAHIVCVGDSPVFRVRGRRADRLSPDPRSDGRRLGAYVGMGKEVSRVMHLRPLPVRIGDVFVLMTDGAALHLSPDELLETWSRTRDPERCARQILDRAAMAGVDDDATVLVVEIHPDTGAPPSVPPQDAPDPPDHLME